MCACACVCACVCVWLNQTLAQRNVTASEAAAAAAAASGNRNQFVDKTQTSNDARWARALALPDFRNGQQKHEWNSLHRRLTMKSSKRLPWGGCLLWPFSEIFHTTHKTDRLTDALTDRDAKLWEYTRIHTYIHIWKSTRCREFYPENFRPQADRQKEKKEKTK